jgi:hypothetical protein
MASRELITREQAEQWAGSRLTDAEYERLAKAIPHSSIPDAIDTIVTSWRD